MLSEWSAAGGYPALYFRDAEGVTRLALFHEAEASGVYVSDETGTTRIGIAQFAHGGGGVALHGPESRGAAVLYYKDDGSLRFFDGNGAVIGLDALTAGTLTASGVPPRGSRWRTS